mgnify:FL=1
MAQREVKAGIVLGGRVDGSVNVIGAKLDELAGKADLLGEKWLRQGARIDQVGRQIINLGKESVSVYRNYEDGILETRSVLQGVYGNNELNKVMESLEKHAQRWAASTIFHTDDVADAMATAAHAGWDYEKILAGLPSAMLAAQAGGMELTQTVDYLAKMLAATNTPFSESERLIDEWARAADLVATDIPELGNAFIRLGASAQFADSNEELLTMLAILANVGTVGETAGTGVRNMMLRMVAPTKSAAAAMDTLGMSEEELEEAFSGVDAASAEAYETLEQYGFSAYDAQGNLKSFIQIFTDLNDALEKLPSEQERNDILATLFPSRTISYAKAMVEAVKNGSIYDIYNTIANESSGYAQRKQDILMSGLTGALETLGSKAEEVKRKIGEELAPQVTGVSSALGNLLDSIAEMDDAKFTGLVTGLETIAALGAGLLVAGTAMKLIGLFLAGGYWVVGAAAIIGIAKALKELDEQQFRDKFGDMDLDTDTLSAYVKDLNAAFQTGYTEINSYRDALEGAVTSYTTASQRLSGDLLTKAITGATLTDAEKEQIKGLGRTMGDEVLSGIQASFDETAAYLEMLYGGTGEAKNNPEYQAAILLTDSIHSMMMTEARQLGEDFNKTLSAAMDDSIVTGDEYAVIMEKLQAYNEALAYAQQADMAGEMAVQLHKAQSVSWDSFADFASQTEDAFGSAMATEEDAYIRQRAKQEAYYRYAIEHGYTNKLTGKAYTVEDWEKFAASYDAQYQARRIALTDQNAQVMATAFDALIASSDYGDAWKLIKNVYAAYGGLDTAFDEYGNYSDIDWSRFTDETDIAALGDQVYGLYKDLGRFEKILKPYKDSAFGGQMLTMLGMTEGLSNVLYASDRGAGAYSGSIAEDMTAQFGQKIEVTDDGTAAETRAEIEQVFAEPIEQEVQIVYKGGSTYVQKSAPGVIHTPGKGLFSNMLSLFAEGGRSEEPAIFGEDGPEWAIPEEHSSRTAQLLDAARRGSGFTWKEILERNGGLNANPHSGGSRTLVYSPTIYARDADGVEARLLEDKARLEKWWRERALREEVEVYA